jgi:tRNA (Thr-GGU) A37 N-methylase
MELKPIGIIHTPYRTPGDAPFQGRSSSETCEIEIFKEYEAGLASLQHDLQPDPIRLDFT